jgi:hypothetical protein
VCSSDLIFWYRGAPGATTATSTGTTQPTPPLHCGGAVTPQRLASTQRWSPFVSQSVRYAAEFPLHFTIPVDTVPPADALTSLSASGGTGAYSMGLVVAFRDLDGDGAYDFGAPDVAPEPILASSVVASGPSAQLLFVDGHGGELDAMPGVTGAPQGFSVLSSDATSTTHLGDVATTPVTLALGQSDVTALYGCQTRQLVSIEGPAEPANAERTCLSPDSYLWQVRATPSACTEEVTRGITCASAPHTADWPCH